MDIVSNLFTIVMYVLLSIGLYTIAKRRGIGNAWLAWIPVGSVWILGAIADDYKQKTQRKDTKKRVIMVVLVAVSLVLCIVAMGILVSNVVLPMLEILPEEDILALYEAQNTGSDSLDYMYAVGEGELEQLEKELTEKMLAALDEKATEELLTSAMYGSVMLLAVAILSAVAAVYEVICLYQLYESCDPTYKVLFLILSMVVGIQGVFVFMLREKDLGMMPPAPPAPDGFDPNGTPNYWQNP